MRRAVAISTTGHEHRLGFLETTVQKWDAALRPGDSLFVTVDGNAADVARVAARVEHWTASVFRVGHPITQTPQHVHRLGVAVNKNTGLELMYDNTKADHFFLSDDDVYPLYPQSLDKHTDLPIHHSMVCWGKSRLLHDFGPYADWKWPRGVVLHQTRVAVETVGGMDERFGPGGHEHAEYSQRMFNAHLTPAPFVTPASYATRGGMGARAMWYAEDMARPGEILAALGARRKRNTSIDPARDWASIHKIMDEREGSSDFVPFRAHENGRASATLFPNLTSQGADK